MAKYLLAYRAGSDAGSSEEWRAFITGTVGEHCVDLGLPIHQATAPVGETGPSTRLSGYTVIEAADLAAATAIAHGAPTLAHGGGVEVGELVPLPDPRG